LTFFFFLYYFAGLILPVAEFKGSKHRNDASGIYFFKIKMHPIYA